MAAGGGSPKVRLNTAVMKAARSGFAGASRGNGGRAATKHSTPDMRYGRPKNAPPGDSGVGSMRAPGGAVINKVARSTPDWSASKIMRMTRYT